MGPMVDYQHKKTPRDMLRLLFRRRTLFLASAVTFCMACLTIAHYLPLQYTGVTKVRRTMEVAGEELNAGRSESFAATKEKLQEDLIGYAAVAEAADELKLTAGLPHEKKDPSRLTAMGEMEKQQLIRQLRAGLKLNWDVQKDTVDEFTLTFTHAEADKAEKLPNVIVDRYMNRVMEETGERLRKNEQWLKDQVDKVERQVESLTRERLAFEEKYAAAWPEKASKLQEDLQRLRGEVDQNDNRLLFLMQHQARLKGMAFPATATATSQKVQEIRGPNPERKRLESQLVELKEQLDGCTTMRHMTASHPTVQSLKEKIADLEKRVKETPVEVVLQSVYGTDAPAARDVAIELAAVASEIEIVSNRNERMKVQLAETEKALQDFAPVRQSYLQLTRKIDDKQAELKAYKDRHQETKMALEAEAARRRMHIDVRLRAQPQHQPSSPSLWKVLLVAIFGGLAFGGGIVFVASSLDRTFTSSEDAAKHLNIPVQGIIGEIILPAQRRNAWLRRWLMAPFVSLVVLMVLGLSAMSISLRLTEPNQGFWKWRNAPASYLRNDVLSPAVNAIKQTLDR